MCTMERLYDSVGRPFLGSTNIENSYFDNVQITRTVFPAPDRNREWDSADFLGPVSGLRLFPRHMTSRNSGDWV